MARATPAVVALLVLAAGLAGCAERARLPPVDGTGGPGRVAVDAPAGRSVELLLDGDAIADAVADGTGPAVFVGLAPGPGYRVRLAADDLRGPLSGPVVVGPRAPALLGNVTAAIVAAAEPDAALTLRRGGTVVAEVAAGPDGRRVVANLTAGTNYTATQTVDGRTSPASPPASVAPAAIGGDGHVTVAGARPGASIALLSVAGPAGPDPRRDPVQATGSAGDDGTVTFAATDGGDPLPPGPGYYAIQQGPDGPTRPSNVVVVS